jgi:hypothetical protein
MNHVLNRRKLKPVAHNHVTETSRERAHRLREQFYQKHSKNNTPPMVVDNNFKSTSATVGLKLNMIATEGFGID